MKAKITNFLFLSALTITSCSTKKTVFVVSESKSYSINSKGEEKLNSYSIYEYDKENVLVKISQYAPNTNGVSYLNSESFYSYDKNNNIEKIETKQFDDFGNVKQLTINSYENYVSSGNPKIHIETTYKTDFENPYSLYKYEYEYDNLNRQISSISYRNNDEGQLTSYAKGNISYLGDMDLILESVSYVYSSNEWIENIRLAYEYDNENRVKKSENYSNKILKSYSEFAYEGNKCVETSFSKQTQETFYKNFERTLISGQDFNNEKCDLNSVSFTYSSTGNIIAKNESETIFDFDKFNKTTETKVSVFDSNLNVFNFSSGTKSVITYTKK